MNIGLTGLSFKGVYVQEGEGKVVPPHIENSRAYGQTKAALAIKVTGDDLKHADKLVLNKKGETTILIEGAAVKLNVCQDGKCNKIDIEKRSQLEQLERLLEKAKSIIDKCKEPELVKETVYGILEKVQNLLNDSTYKGLDSQKIEIPKNSG